MLPASDAIALFDAKKFFDDEPTTPYGYYSSEDNALVMNIGPGAGTLSHELVHPYIEANFPDAPSWFNEGLASLYEQPRERDGHMWGTTNWRLPGLTAMIKAKTLPSLADLLKTSREEFYDQQRVAKVERIEAQVEQADDAFGRAVGVHGREHQVAGQ